MSLVEQFHLFGTAVQHYHCAASDIGPFDLLTTAAVCCSAAKGLQ